MLTTRIQTRNLDYRSLCYIQTYLYYRSLCNIWTHLESRLQQPVLHLDYMYTVACATSRRILYTTGACATCGRTVYIHYISLGYIWTYIEYRSLCCIWTYLNYRSLYYVWTYLDYRSLCFILIYLDHRSLFYMQTYPGYRSLRYIGHIQSTGAFNMLRLVVSKLQEPAISGRIQTT